ncbi:MAG: imidazole glycerol phosphate synthase subunit HisH [Acidimicrobiia bacterium]|nr:imidazole glycerol phosphate synthase subunit HisH [Acidimicrobiia bacterium]
MPDRPAIAILDYGIGNLHSAQKGFEHAGADARLTDDWRLIDSAEGIVLPGVGAFGPTVEALRSTGLAELVHQVIADGRPFMGICVGMQVLFASSEEAPDTPGLGVFDRPVRWLSTEVKRPQMQWNVLDRRVDHPMFAGLPAEAWVYFVHSLAVTDADDVIATCDYGGPVVAASARDNVWTAQFHPEKSGRNGLRILGNFVDWCATGRCQ